MCSHNDKKFNLSAISTNRCDKLLILLIRRSEDETDMVRNQLEDEQTAIAGASLVRNPGATFTAGDAS